VQLCAALRIEALALAGRSRQVRNRVIVVGMRARRRDRLARLAAHDGPIVLVGFGGGLDRSQRAGDVVVATEIRHPGGQVPLPGAPALLASLRDAGLVASGGPIWCSTHIVRGSQRAALAAAGAVAVDMESAAVVEACGAERVVVARVIVDTPTRGLVLGCILGGRRAWRALRAVGDVLRALRAVGDVLRALRAVGMALDVAEWSARDDSITSGTVKSGGTPQRQAG
jgi:4-hydroxy-3-methylbut-2-enyl diphosphate reductase